MSRPADGGARQLNRLKDSGRSQRAGAPHLDLHIQQGGDLLLRRILKGDRPFGEFCRRTQQVALGKIVHLDDGAVDVKAVGSPTLADLPDLLDCLLDAVHPQIGGRHLKAQSFQPVQRFLVAQNFLPLHLLQVKDKDIQPPLRGDFGIFLPQRTSRCVARIFKGLFLVELLLGHHLLKAGHRHIDLAAHLQIGHRFL